MRRFFMSMMLVLVMIVAAPIYAGGGSLGSKSGGVSITSRESHTGKPGPGLGVSGSSDRSGSTSLAGKSSNGSEGWFISLPIRMGGASTYFYWFFWAIRITPAWSF